MVVFINIKPNYWLFKKANIYVSKLFKDEDKWDQYRLQTNRSSKVNFDT